MNVQDDLERLTADGLLDDVEEWDVGRVREFRDACRELEERVSYQRRMAQGRLDIARAERERRDRGGDLVDALPEILADRPTGRARSDRSLGLIDPGDEDFDGEGVPLSRLPDLEDDALADLIAHLETAERALSRSRRPLLDNLDRLQDELVKRYRDGSADVDEVMKGDAEPRSPSEE
jgi:hypothetical protein